MTKTFVVRPLFNVYRNLSGARRTYYTRRDHIFANYGPLLKEDILTEEDRRIRADNYRRFGESLGRLAEIASEREIRIVGFVMPYAMRFEPDTEASDYIDLDGHYDDRSYALYLEQVRGMLEGLGVDYLDLEPHFRAAYDADPAARFYIPGDLHLNVAGNRLVAEALSDHLGSTGE